MATITALIDEWAKMPVADWAENDYGWITEAHRPIILAAWQRLNRGGIRTEEFSQHPNQMTKAGNALFDTIRQCKLAVYAGAVDLRECVLNARGKETERGVRLVKQTQSRKIDAAIALAMSVALALEKPEQGPAQFSENNPFYGGEWSSWGGYSIEEEIQVIQEHRAGAIAKQPEFLKKYYSGR